jgi:membrane protein YqaA with SNARE-associated domain
MPDEHPVRELIEEVKELEQEVAPPDPAFVPLAVPKVPVGKIIVFLVCFYTAAILLRAFVLHGAGIVALVKAFIKPGAQITARGSILFDFFFYMCLACQFFPLPTIPPIAFTAKLFSPLLVAFVASVGTCIANLNDYAILGWLFRHQRVQKIRDLSGYRRLLHFFDRYAFLTLAGAAFLPIPIDVIRLLAISRAYSYWKYIAATFTGRMPRYLIIAYLGKELPAKYILLLFLVTSLPAVIKLVSDMIKKKKKKA